MRHYVPVAESVEDLRLKRLLDEIYLRDPCLGTRRLVTLLERDYGEKVNRKRLQRGDLSARIWHAAGIGKRA